MITRATDAAGIKAVQKQLQDLGYSVGKTGTDGVWGKNTEAAYQSYLNAQRGQQVSQIQSLLDGAMNSANNIGAVYDAAGSKFTNAQNAAYEATKSNLESQGSKLAEQYNNIRNQAYVNARLNSIGNNEVLAAKGLAGGLYDGPASGVSETSRVAQDVGMRNNINLATRQEQTAKDEIAQQIIQAGYTRDQNIANYLAEQAIAKAQAEAVAQQQTISNAIPLMQFQNSLISAGNAAPVRSGRTLTLEEQARAFAAALAKQNGTTNTQSIIKPDLQRGKRISGAQD